MFYKNMSNINFTARLRIDDSLTNTFKTANLESVVNKVRTMVESPMINKLIGDDEVILSSLSNPKKEGVLIKIGEKLRPIGTKRTINASEIIHQILLLICEKKDITPMDGSFKKTFEALTKFLEKTSK